MKRIFYAAFLFCFIQNTLQAQQANARVNALIESSVKQEGLSDPNFAVFRTMESVRHGLLPGYKGIQVNVEQPICDGQPGSIALLNDSGEPWKYKVIDRNGPLVGEGDVGYNRRISQLPTGAYMIQFTLADGTSVIDEFRIHRGTGLTASIEIDKSKTATAGQSIEFTGRSIGANEFTWDFGDGNTAYGDHSVIHTYKNPGTYTVTLLANNFDCKAEASIKVFVVGIPAATGPGE